MMQNYSVQLIHPIKFCSFKPLITSHVTFSQSMTYQLSFITQSKGDNSNKIKNAKNKKKELKMCC